MSFIVFYEGDDKWCVRLFLYMIAGYIFLPSAICECCDVLFAGSIQGVETCSGTSVFRQPADRQRRGFRAKLSVASAGGTCRGESECLSPSACHVVVGFGVGAVLSAIIPSWSSM